MAALPATRQRTTIRFGLFELDTRAQELHRRGRIVRLQKQPFDLLTALVERPGEVISREALRQRLWAPDTFVDFDQGLNKIVRKLREALGDSADAPRYIETVQRIGYRFIAPVNRSEISLFETEAASIETPSKLAFNEFDHPDEQLEQKQPVPRPGAQWKRLLAWSLSVLALPIVVVAFRTPLLQRLPPPHIKSLAVLPLENLSGDSQQDFFADGMTDELTTMLVRYSTLRIISRTSAMQFKQSHHPVPEIAHALGVDAVIEGAVAREGTRMHMTLQLISADNDSHLWAESYDRALSQSGTLPEEGARAIAARLHSASPAQVAVRFVSPEAHEAYLRGRYLWPTPRQAASGAFLIKATKIQPDYVEAWAGLSDYYGAGIAGGSLDPRVNSHLQEEAAEHVVALAPNTALAHEAKAGVYLIDRWDANSADQELLSALRLDPNEARFYYLQGCILSALDRLPASIEAEKRFMELDPYEIPAALASIYRLARLYDDALAEIRLRSEAAPNDLGLLFEEKEVWRSKGNYKEAMEAWAKFHQAAGDPKSAAEVRHAYAVGGKAGFVRWELQRRLDQLKTMYVSPVELASYYAQLGDREHALPLLEEGYRQHSTDFLWVAHDPAYDFLHSEPRYQSLMQMLAQHSAHKQ